MGPARGQARAPTLPFLAVAACLLGGLRGCSADTTLPTAWRTGIATNYGGPADGMNPSDPSMGTSIGGCGYGLLDKSQFPYWSVGALSTSNMYFLAGPQKGCGMCFQIQCLQQGGQFAGRCNQDPNSRSVTIMITDGCPECEADHIDIQAMTFNKIAPIANGRIDIQYRRVQCTPPSGLVINVDQNNGAGGWLRMTVQKTGGPGSIQLVQIKGPNTGWQDMKNTWGAAWEMPVSPQPPLDLRIVSTDGSEVTAFSFIQANGQKGKLPTGINFAAQNPPDVTPITTVAGVGASDGGGVSSASAVASSFGGSASASASASAGGSQQVSAYEGPPQSSSPPPPTSPASWSSPPPQSPATYPPPSNSGNRPPPPPYNSGSPPPPPPYSSSSPPPPPPSSSSSSSGSPSPPPPPPPPPSPSSSGGSSSWTCQDNQPPGSSYACSLQKQWGNCNAGWMTTSSSAYPKGYCAKTCGRC